jgi:SAM-dependent methyltransferase
MTIQSPFTDFSRYYDLLYHDKDYESEANYIKTILTRHGVAGGTVLEFGSGTGKHGCLLAQQGYKVHGIERSAGMVSQSASSEGFTCEQGDICSVQIHRIFDAVLSLFHVISYQTSNTALIEVFARAAEHLRIGGLFIFDFWYSPSVYTQRPTVRVKRISDHQVDITRIAEPVIYPNDNRVDVVYTIFARDLISNAVQTTTETHPMRHFSLPEIDLLASTQGFERISAEESFTGKPTSEHTWSVCVTLKKI